MRDGCIDRNYPIQTIDYCGRIREILKIGVQDKNSSAKALQDFQTNAITAR